MSTDEARLQNKFSAALSRFLLPTFRRPCYLDIKRKEVDDEPINPGDIFHQWTLEGNSPLYKKINDALLCDNSDKLNEHVVYINQLRRAIKENHQPEAMTVYRNLQLDPTYVRNEYKENEIFLWPTFSSTSRNKDIASKFGNYAFEIRALPNDVTYRTDISNYSRFPHEQEVLFYPYSGFRVKRICSDARIITLECVDTKIVESRSKQLVPEHVKLFDESRQLFVYLHKDSPDVECSSADTPDEIFIIADNPNGYWDSPHRYNHKNGYFLNKEGSRWEEYQGTEHQDNQQIGKFEQIS